MKRFGVSTHLYHDHALDEAHLVEIAGHGFEAIELFATRSHFDYHDRDRVRALAGWLGRAGLALHSMHAPITDAFRAGRIQRSYSIATRDTGARSAAVSEILAALELARTIPFRYLVVHLGLTTSQRPSPDDNDRDAALKSLEQICDAAKPLGVQVALEVIENPLSTPDALVTLIERSFEGADVGICMDVGHAHLLGDAGEAIEVASEFLVTTQIHDNRRDGDDHLAPFQGTIDWPSTIMALEKIGYDGVLMYEVRETDTARAVLERARTARTRLEGLMLDGALLSAFSRRPDPE